MKNLLTIGFLIYCYTFNFAQNNIKTDTLLPIKMQEVIIIGKKAQLFEKQTKVLTTLDDYLQKSAKVGMIKRGAYAWEPTLNSMSTERTLITIDGMRIFGACTDKMDPITSYVEVSNLSEATVCSGQEGSCFGNTIGGSIDLKRNNTVFGAKNWNFNINSGFETNNKQKIIGSSIQYQDSLFYFDTDFMLRDAENYKAGKHQEILFSQFKKVNFSSTSGFKIDKNKHIEASLIYDKATNVGYPALPMDVSIAEAIITSLKYDYSPLNKKINHWETKLYYNTIMHKMDDTKRPFVPIHMDMPGWSKTFGFYSKLNFKQNQHHFLLNINSFYNTSLAEMTMYPANPNENPMFMLTWPDVLTAYHGAFLEDSYFLNCHSNVKFSASLGNHANTVQSTFGLNSLQIFYPNMTAKSNRVLKSFAGNYNYFKNHIQFGFGVAYGERAPSVTEAYGFYLFNSFENYDNIGNPNLKNESSFEGNFFFEFKKEKIALQLNSSYFHIANYIVGKPNPALVPMTIGATGVKIYSALDYATIFNVSLQTEYKFSKYVKSNMQLVYSRGKDFMNINLPFISPIRYSTSILYTKNRFSSELSIQGNTKQVHFGAIYGEDKTPDYALLHANVGYKFTMPQAKVILKLGVENLLDAYYSTYSDWNNLPRQGRNCYINTVFSF